MTNIILQALEIENHTVMIMTMELFDNILVILRMSAYKAMDDMKRILQRPEILPLRRGKFTIGKVKAITFVI